MTQKPMIPIAKRNTSKEGLAFASIVLWFFTALILATIAGLWFKLFWLGWVLVLKGC